LVLKSRELSIVSVKGFFFKTLLSKWYFQFVSGKKLNKEISSSDNSNKRCFAEIEREKVVLSQAKMSI